MNAPASAREIFEEALDHPPEQWPHFLELACGGDLDLQAKVQRLLDAHGELGSFMDCRETEMPGTSGLPTGDLIGVEIGPYKLLEQIGEGGMGIVYVAEQRKPISRQVALKVIKPGMDSRQVIARFEAERQALALMDHPHIARVIDGGSTEQGRPYFVMELVRGVPITEFCDTEQYSIRQRLELFAQVCHAVQHAHQKGIIHRDLKPSNILVTHQNNVPIPKVIDFGVAKAINQSLTDKTIYTQYSQLVGTPLYMSPEQTQHGGLDIDTRSDVYSLGVLLYELLTGTTPFDATLVREKGLDNLCRMIRDEYPARPSDRISRLNADTGAIVSQSRCCDLRRLRLRVRRELDWIVMRCLEKDRGRRYQSARELEEDLQRFSSNRPVQAGPPSQLYRLTKFAFRNSIALATSVLVVSTLVAATAVSWRHAYLTQMASSKLKQETNLKEASFREVRYSINALVAEMATSELASRPEFRSLHQRINREAGKAFDRFIKLNPDDHHVLADRANLHFICGEDTPAAECYARAIVLQPNDPDLHAALATVLRRKAFQAKENFTLALHHANRAIELQPTNPDFYLLRARVYVRLGAAKEVRHDVSRAVALGNLTAERLNWISYCYQRIGDYGDALPFALKAMQESPENSEYQLMLGTALVGLKRDEEAIVAFTRSIDTYVHHIAPGDYGHSPHFLRGQANARLDRESDALADFSDALRFGIRDQRVFTERSIVRFKLDDLDGALEDLTSALHAEKSGGDQFPLFPIKLVVACNSERFQKRFLDLLDEWLTQNSDSAQLYIDRGQLHIAMNKPELARIDFALACERNADSHIHYLAALTALQSSTTHYQFICKQVLHRYGKSTNITDLYYTVWTSALGPADFAERDQMLALRKHAIREHAARQLKRDRQSLGVLGALQFRLGEFVKAEQTLKAALVDPRDPHAIGANIGYFLAMTHERLGQHEQALSWLAKARKDRDAMAAAAAKDPAACPWDRKLVLELLDAEATALVQPNLATEASATADH